MKAFVGSLGGLQNEHQALKLRESPFRSVASGGSLLNDSDYYFFPQTRASQKKSRRSSARKNSSNHLRSNRVRRRHLPFSEAMARAEQLPFQILSRARTSRNSSRPLRTS